MAKAQSPGDAEKKLQELKLSRRGKKGSITKRMQHINKMVEDGGSRRVIRTLITALRTKFDELNDVCTQIAASTEEVDEINCTEELQASVDLCIVLAEDDLEARRDDPPSTGSVASAWVANCTSRMFDGEAASEGSMSSDEARSEMPDDDQHRESQLQGMDHFVSQTNQFSTGREQVQDTRTTLHGTGIGNKAVGEGTKSGITAEEDVQSGRTLTFVNPPKSRTVSELFNSNTRPTNNHSTGTKDDVNKSIKGDSFDTATHGEMASQAGNGDGGTRKRPAQGPMAFKAERPDWIKRRVQSEAKKLSAQTVRESNFLNTQPTSQPLGTGAIPHPPANKYFSDPPFSGCSEVG